MAARHCERYNVEDKSSTTHSNEMLVAGSVMSLPLTIKLKMGPSRRPKHVGILRVAHSGKECQFGRGYNVGSLVKLR